jgi:type I restriction enzyme, S subunit
MNPEFLLAHFDRINDAPAAVPRLRSFILDLAVRGKLVEHDPADEPAALLLNRIRAEKARLVKQGSIKHKEISGTTTVNCPSFLAPLGWVLTTLGEVTQKITDGAHKTPTYVDDGIPFISVKDFSGGTLDFSSTRLIPASEHAMLHKRCDPRRGDILIGRIGTLGKAVLVDTDREFSLFVSVGLIRFSHESIAPPYFRLVLNSPLLEGEYDRIKVGGGTHTNKLNLGDLHGVIFPLPPLAEQHRIVAKVDELMALCDHLEAARNEQESRRDRLAAASLHRLSNGANAEAFRNGAQFYLSHLSRLTTRPEHVRPFRQTILNLAVRGRLVPQGRADEAASELLKRIQAEKARLINERRLRKEKPLPPVADDEAPFTIPTSWIWARIGTVSLLTDYGTSVKSDHVENGVPVLKMGDIQGGQVILGGQKMVPRKIDDLPQLFLKRFDLLYNRTNSAELVGKTGIYMGDDDAYTFASYLIRIRFLSNLTSPVYANLAMNAPYFRATQIIPKLQQQCGQANVNGTKLRYMLIPLPPPAEQRRIVTKVDELMTVCDELEKKLSDTQTECHDLLEAVLHHALSDSRRSEPEKSSAVLA